MIDSIGEVTDASICEGEVDAVRVIAGGGAHIDALPLIGGQGMDVGALHLFPVDP